MAKVKPAVLNGTDGDDSLDCILASAPPSPGGCLVHGRAGNDTLLGAESPAGDDRLYGGKDNDIIVAYAGNDTVHGGPGDDWICADCTGTQAEVSAEWGNNVVQGGPGNDALMDTLTKFGSYGNDLLYGGPGDDSIWLQGGGGSNRAFGGAGDDVLTSQGVLGPHELTGGPGADTFVVVAEQAANEDRQVLIVDFKPKQGDRLEFKLWGEDVNPLDHPDFTVTVELVTVDKKAKPSTVITHHPGPNDPEIDVPGQGEEFNMTSKNVVTKLYGYVGIADKDFILPPPAPASF
jgi:Ca2+-binding RTX toxin-like protein